jgi:hypothetical protein
MNSNLLRQLQEMQRRADELQKGLAAMEVEGIAGGGLVRATMNGLGDLKQISIDPSLLKPDEHQIVEDLVVAACADGKAKLEARRFQDPQFVQDLLKSFSAGLSDSD